MFTGMDSRLDLFRGNEVVSHIGRLVDVKGTSRTSLLSSGVAVGLGCVSESFVAVRRADKVSVRDGPESLVELMVVPERDSVIVIVVRLESLVPLPFAVGKCPIEGVV